MYQEKIATSICNCIDDCCYS